MGFQYSNSMQFDSLTFQQKILIDGFNGLGTENPRSRFMLGVDAIVVSILSFETRCSISASSPV